MTVVSVIRILGRSTHSQACRRSREGGGGGGEGGGGRENNKGGTNREDIIGGMGERWKLPHRKLCWIAYQTIICSINSSTSPASITMHQHFLILCSCSWMSTQS